MAREYFKVFNSYLKSIEPLTKEERGDLFTALLIYHITGEVPELTGGERYIFPTFQQNMDRDIIAYENVANAARENGKKGGRRKKSNNEADNTQETEKTDSLSFAPKERQDKDKDNDKDKDKDKDKDNDNDVLSLKESVKRKDAPRFSPPTIQEIEAYCLEAGLHTDPQIFYDYYASNGWMVSKNHMQDWQAALRRWERNRFPYADAKGGKSRATPFPSSFETDDFFEAALAKSYSEADKIDDSDT